MAFLNMSVCALYIQIAPIVAFAGILGRIASEEESDLYGGSFGYAS